MAVPFNNKSQSVPEEQEGCATNKAVEQTAPVCAFRIRYLDSVVQVSRDVALLNPVGKVAFNWHEYHDLAQHLELEVVGKFGIMDRRIVVRPTLTVQLSDVAFQSMVIEMLRKNNVAVSKGDALLRFSRTFDHMFDIESLFRGAHLYSAPNQTRCTHFVDLAQSGVEHVELLKANGTKLFEIVQSVLSSSNNNHRNNQHSQLALTYNKMVAATAAVDIARSEALHDGLAKAYIDISFGKLLAEQTIAIRNYEQAQSEVVDYDNIQSIAFLGATIRKTEQ